MKLIPLSQGKFAKVDDSDFEELSSFIWCYANGYARRTVPDTKGAVQVFMHRQIMELTRGEAGMVDHIDGDRSNNQRSNLRICDYRQNMWNSSTSVRNKSGHRGVSWSEKNNRWRAGIRANGKTKELGKFSSLEDAVAAYAKAANELYGEFSPFQRTQK